MLIDHENNSKKHPTALVRKQATSKVVVRESKVKQWHRGERGNKTPWCLSSSSCKFPICCTDGPWRSHVMRGVLKPGRSERPNGGAHGGAHAKQHNGKITAAIKTWHHQTHKHYCTSWKRHQHYSSKSRVKHKRAHQRSYGHLITTPAKPNRLGLSSRTHHPPNPSPRREWRRHAMRKTRTLATPQPTNRHPHPKYPHASAARPPPPSPPSPLPLQVHPLLSTSKQRQQRHFGSGSPPPAAAPYRLLSSGPLGEKHPPARIARAPGAAASATGWRPCS